MGTKNRKLYDFYFKTIIFHLFQKNLDAKKIVEDEILADDASQYNKIRCPLCQWQPNKSSLWFCTSSDFPEFYYGGCGTAWNTFDTRGKCPGCHHQWCWTTCLSCHKNSLHESWYQ